MCKIYIRKNIYTHGYVLLYESLNGQAAIDRTRAAEHRQHRQDTSVANNLNRSF
jgi:hypothetical protein